MTGNVRDEDSPPKIRESLLEKSKESLLKAVMCCVSSIFRLASPNSLVLLNSASTQHQ